MRRWKKATDTNEQGRSTAANESVILTSVIDAHNNRNVATLDIPSAFLRALNDDSTVLMLLEGTLAELMVKVAPRIYRKYVTIGKSGKKLLYVQMHKALYGMLKSALLFYKKFVSDLESIGFTTNPYNCCK